MAVLFVGEVSPMDSGEEVDAAVGRITRNYRRSFKVLFDEEDPFTTQQTLVRSAVDPDSGVRVPRKNQSHPADPFAFVHRVRATQVPERWDMWNVLCEYRTNETVAEGDEREPQLDPLLKPAEVELVSQRITEHTDVDRQGNPIATVLGEYYREGTEVDSSRSILAIVKNIPLGQLPSLLTIQDAVNSSRFRVIIDGVPTFTIGKREGKLTGFRARLQRASGFTYWEFSFELHVKEKRWIRRLVHRGTRELITVDGVDKIVQAVEDDGEPVQKEIFLDEEGRRLALGADPHIQQFQIYEEADFGAIGL